MKLSRGNREVLFQSTNLEVLCLSILPGIDDQSPLTSDYEKCNDGRNGDDRSAELSILWTGLSSIGVRVLHKCLDCEGKGGLRLWKRCGFR